MLLITKGGTINCCSYKGNKIEKKKELNFKTYLRIFPWFKLTNHYTEGDNALNISLLIWSPLNLCIFNILCFWSCDLYRKTLFMNTLVTFYSFVSNFFKYSSYNLFITPPWESLMLNQYTYFNKTLDLCKCLLKTK